jgi:hypothetical protein
VIKINAYQFEGGRCTLSKIPKEPAQGCLAREGDEVSGSEGHFDAGSFLPKQPHAGDNTDPLQNYKRKQNKT